MKICMAAPFDIKNKLSWSGTPLSLYNALKNCDGNSVDTINLSEYHNKINTRLNALKNCDLKVSIKQRHIVSKLGPSAMNPLNSKLLHSHCSSDDFDILIEFGGFQPGKDLPPYYVYTDSSHDLKLDYLKKYGYFPYGSENDSVESVNKAAESVKSVYQNAAGVFCMSEWLATSMINTTGVSKEKVHVVYAGANWHGVDLPQVISKKSIKNKNEIHLIIVGVDYRGKGMDIAVEAVRYLNSSNEKKYILHVCGVREIPVKDDYIINHSFVDKNKLIELLSSCDVFVLPSRFDCFGISFVEAMTFGLPCIGRNICAMPEIIDEGINGELITTDDYIELAGKIKKICSDEDVYESYSTAAIEKSKLFTWEKVAERMMKVINDDHKKIAESK